MDLFRDSDVDSECDEVRRRMFEKLRGAYTNSGYSEDEFVIMEAGFNNGFIEGVLWLSGKIRPFTSR